MRHLPRSTSRLARNSRHAVPGDELPRPYSDVRMMQGNTTISIISA